MTDDQRKKEKERQKSEEAFMAVRDIGRLVWNMYQGFLGAGFNEPQAFQLINTYMHGFARGPGHMSGPETDWPGTE
jgi:hypothetical protein